jgi:hypothetical protein
MILSLAYPNLLGTKRLGYCCCSYIPQYQGMYLFWCSVFYAFQREKTWILRHAVPLIITLLTTSKYPTLLVK